MAAEALEAAVVLHTQEAVGALLPRLLPARPLIHPRPAPAAAHTSFEHSSNDQSGSEDRSRFASIQQVLINS